MPAQSRSSILLVSGSCSVFPLRKTTRIGHQNLIPVSIPSTMKALSPESSTGISGNVSQILKIPGRTRAAVTHLCMLLGCAVYHLACGVQPWGIHKLNFLFGAVQNGSGVLSALECYTGY